MQPLDLALCKSITSLEGISADTYVMEPKLDGFRIQLLIQDGTVTLFTRTAKSATGKMPAVETAFSDVADSLHGTVLDGEAVYITKSGKADFHYTASVMGSGEKVAAEKQRTSRKYVSFIAFDILVCQGTDVRHLPLEQRRMLLERVVASTESDYVRCTEWAQPTAENHQRFTDEYGEGSVIKLLSAPYIAKRSTAMLKWKKVLDEDVVVLGSTPGNGKFEGQLGAVIFGQHGTPGKKHKCTALCSGTLHERGQCSGMTDDVRREMTERLPLGAVMVITHNGILADEGFRHPQFSYFRFDKTARECTWTVA